jgi:hypothetical protein
LDCLINIKQNLWNRLHADLNLVFNASLSRCNARILVGISLPRIVAKPDSKRRTYIFFSIRLFAPRVNASLCIHSGCVFDIFFLYLRKGDKLWRKKSCSSKVRKGRIYKVFLPFCISLRTSWHIIWLSCAGTLTLALATIVVPIGVATVVSWFTGGLPLGPHCYWS